MHTRTYLLYILFLKLCVFSNKNVYFLLKHKTYIMPKPMNFHAEKYWWIIHQILINHPIIFSRIYEILMYCISKEIFHSFVLKTMKEKIYIRNYTFFQNQNCCIEIETLYCAWNMKVIFFFLIYNFENKYKFLLFKF